MALATKCPHCNTIFRVAHDQLKLRGGIVRCGACNEVFDGNAALVEPAVAKAPMAPLPSSTTHSVSAELAVLDAAMAALDTRAAVTLPPDEAAPIYTLDVETAEQADDGHPRIHTDEASAPPAAQAEQAPAVFDEAVASYDTPATADSITDAALPPSVEEALDLDLDVELDAPADTAIHDADDAVASNAADADAEPAADLRPADFPADAPLSTANVTDDAAPSFDRADELAVSPDHVDAAADAGRHPDDNGDVDPAPAAKSDEDIAAELAALSQAGTESEPSFDAIVELASELSAEPQAAADDYTQDGRREPTLGEPPSEHLVAAALDDHYHDDLDATREDDALAAAVADAGDADAKANANNADADNADANDIDTDAFGGGAKTSVNHTDDEVHVSAVGLARASSEPVAHAAPGDAIDVDAEAAPDANADADDAEEPGFVKRDRRRQKMGKAARIAMSVGSVALLVALLAQGIGTFRNQLAAELPQLKPALVSACALLGCKVELPTQIDDLSIEPGELQTVAENTYSFTTQLRNGGAITQAWPHIELVLNDNADKPVLRRVFAPRDYLATPADAAQGFAPRFEQSVKLYFEIAQLKASGYHIAVFYP